MGSHRVRDWTGVHGDHGEFVQAYFGVALSPPLQSCTLGAKKSERQKLARVGVVVDDVVERSWVGGSRSPLGVLN